MARGDGLKLLLMAKRVFKKKTKERRESMRGRMILGFGSIVIVLLLTCIISNFGYRSMRGRVSELLNRNIEYVKTVNELGNMCEDYNMNVLDALADGRAVEEVRDAFDAELFRESCGSLKDALKRGRAGLGEMTPGLVDSLETHFVTYNSALEQLQEELEEGAEDGLRLYFVVLEPQYTKLRESMEAVDEAMSKRFTGTSDEFHEGTYGSMTSVLVAAAVGVLLTLLLLYYISVYYVNPLYRMLKNLEDSVTAGTKYRYEFEGNDQLSELNDQITDIVEENVDLRRRTRVLSEENESLKEAVRAAEE